MADGVRLRGGRPTKERNADDCVEAASAGPKSRTEAAVDLIRSRIIDLTLEPGSRIDEPLLVDEFGLSRTPAREALNRLMAEGFVRIQPNRGGTYVRSLDFREIGEIIAAHQLAETVLGRFLRFSDQALVEDLRRIQQRYVAAVRRKGYLAITEINEEFHLRMHQSIGNSFMYDFVRSTHDHVRRLLVLIYKMEEEDEVYLGEQFEKNLHQHEEIIDAIAKREREVLSEILTIHAKFTQMRLARLIEGRGIERLSVELWPAADG